MDIACGIVETVRRTTVSINSRRFLKLQVPVRIYWTSRTGRWAWRSWNSPCDWLEARVGGDGYLSVTDPVGKHSGLGNVQIAAKLRLWADPGGVPVLSILPTINLPAASESKGLGSGQADFTIAMLTGTDFLTRGHLDINYGVGRIGAGTDCRDSLNTSCGPRAQRCLVR
jgi:hypothetical protein